MQLPWDAIKRIAGHAGIDPALIGAFVAQESGGNPYAVRYEANYKYIVDPAGHAQRLGITTLTETMLQSMSWGVLQIMAGTARDLGFRDPIPRLCEIETGLLWGCLYISRLMHRFPQTKEDAVAAYNAGSPRKTADGKYENANYVDNVMRYYAQFKNGAMPGLS